jgi:hypothetical protein
MEPYKNYPLSFGFKNNDVCNSLGDVISSYKYSYINDDLYKYAEGLIEGEWIVKFENSKNKNQYYEIKEMPQGNNIRNNGALVKYNQKRYIEEIIPNISGESMGIYKYKYDDIGNLIEAIYYPKVALDDERVIIRSLIEYSDNYLIIKYLNNDQSIRYIEKYYN